MEDLKPVYIVSLGPGEAGLISLIGGATLWSGKCYFLPENKCAFPVFCSSERIEDKERIYQTLYIADE